MRHRRIWRFVGHTFLIIGLSLVIGTCVYHGETRGWWDGPDPSYHVEYRDGVRCMVTDSPSKARPEVSSCDWSDK